MTDITDLSKADQARVREWLRTKALARQCAPPSWRRQPVPWWAFPLTFLLGTAFGRWVA